MVGKVLIMVGLLRYISTLFLEGKSYRIKLYNQVSVDIALYYR